MIATSNQPVLDNVDDIISKLIDDDNDGKKKTTPSTVPLVDDDVTGKERIDTAWNDGPGSPLRIDWWMNGEMIKGTLVRVDDGNLPEPGTGARKVLVTASIFKLLSEIAHDKGIHESTIIIKENGKSYFFFVPDNNGTGNQDIHVDDADPGKEGGGDGDAIIDGDVNIEFEDIAITYKEPANFEVTWRETIYSTMKVFRGVIIPFPEKRDILPLVYHGASKEYTDENNTNDIIRSITLLGYDPCKYIVKSQYGDAVYFYIEKKEDITMNIIDSFMNALLGKMEATGLHEN